MKNVIQKLNLNCSPRTLLINYYKFKKHGIKVLLPIQRNNTYSNEFKLKVVHEYINDGLSLTDLVVNIPTTSTVNKWISKYLSGKILKHILQNPRCIN